MLKFSKQFFISAFIFLAFLLNISAQQYVCGLSLELESLDKTNKIACYSLYLHNTDTLSYGIAGQNYRIFYDGGGLTYIDNSAVSHLPQPTYGSLVMVQAVKVNGTGLGSLHFESNLGFLNFYIDINNTVSGAVILQKNTKYKVATLCFNILNDISTFSCSDIILAEPGITSDYTNAFNVVSVWLGVDLTSPASITKIESVNSLLNNTIGLNMPTCQDLFGGSILLNSEYANNFSINGGQSYQSSGNFTNLQSGAYNIKLINDQTGCEFDTLVTLDKPKCAEICDDGIDNDEDGLIDCDDPDCGTPRISNIIIKHPDDCVDGRNGIINIVGDSIGSYSINGGQSYQSSGNFTNLQSGTYNIKLKNDRTGCEFDTLVTLDKPKCAEICDDGIDNDEDGLIDCNDPDCGTPRISNIIVKHPDDCVDGRNGEINIIGDSIGSYSINGGQSYQSSGNFTNLQSGTYNIKLKNDRTGCEFDTLVTLDKPKCAEICGDGIDNDEDGLIDCNDPDCGTPRISNIIIKHPDDCVDGRNGEINIVGDSIGSYSINGGQSYQSSGNFTNLQSGTYNIKLKNDRTGCEFDTLVTLDKPKCAEICGDGIDNDEDGLIDCDDPDCGTPRISNIIIKHPDDCVDGRNGIINIVGDSIGSYSINGGQSYQSSGNFTNLQSGAYNIKLKNDRTGCEFDTLVTLDKPKCAEICDDGIDNDEDGLIDCNDPDCNCRPDLFFYPNIVAFDSYQNNAFSFYPNYSRIDRVTKWSIYDRYGNLVYNNQKILVEGESDKFEGIFNNQKLSFGVYIVVIEYYLNSDQTNKKYYKFDLTLI